MKLLGLFTSLVSSLFFTNVAISEEVIYVSKATIYHRGKIVPGKLDREKIFSALTPRATVSALGIYAEFIAASHGKKEPLGFVSCEQVSEKGRGPAEITNVYGLISCNPLTPFSGSAGVVLPPGKKLLVAVRTSAKNYELPAADYTVHKLSSKTTSCQEIADSTPITPGKKRLRVNVYSYSRIANKDKDLVVGRNICVTVTPIGSAVTNMTLHGFVYQARKGKANKLVSAVVCELNGHKELQEGKPEPISLSSCNYSLNNRTLEKNAKLGIELSISFTAVPRLIEGEEFDSVAPVREIEE